MKKKKSSLKDRMNSEGFGRVDKTGPTYKKPVIEIEYVKTGDTAKKKK